MAIAGFILGDGVPSQRVSHFHAGADASSLLQRVSRLSRNQTGASLLSHLAESLDFSGPLIAASSTTPVGSELLEQIAKVSARARRSATRAKRVGMMFMALAMGLLCCAIFWPAIEKYRLHLFFWPAIEPYWQLLPVRSAIEQFRLHIPESIFTGLVQAAFTLAGGFCGVIYLKAKKRQTNIEDALRRLLFEHTDPATRVALLEAVLARTRQSSHSKAAGRWHPDTAEITEKLRAATPGPLEEAQLVAFLAQLKEISIKRYAVGLAAVTATVMSVLSIAAAVVLPFLTTLMPNLIDGDVADLLQPMLAVAPPVFLLALRKEARGKCAALDETVAAFLNDPEPPSDKSARAIAAVASIDGGMATFADQSPRLGQRHE